MCLYLNFLGSQVTCVKDPGRSTGGVWVTQPAKEQVESCVWGDHLLSSSVIVQPHVWLLLISIVHFLSIAALYLIFFTRLVHTKLVSHRAGQLGFHFRNIFRNKI